MRIKINLLKIAIVMMLLGWSELCAFSTQQTSSKNGVYVDYGKNLMWQDDLNAREIRKNWDNAIEYCENLTLGGYSDWYLPNKENLETLYKQSNLLKNKLSSGYWSSTPVLGKNDSSWVVFFGSGKEAWRSKKYP